MKRPSFFYGVSVALGIAATAGALFAASAPLFGTTAALRMLVPAMALAYLLCLLHRSPERTGRVTTLVLWAAASLLVWLLAPSLSVYVLVHAGLLWLVRSLYFHSGPLSSLLDFGLTTFGVCAASWALTRSGSVFLAAWCFFLVQAAFVVIPPIRPERSRGFEEQENQAFERARQRADAALRDLFTR